MTKRDINGRPYASLSQTHPGDILIADNGFVSDDHNGKDIHCIRPNRRCKVLSHPNGLAVRCVHGLHFLEGQLDYEDKDSLIGFYST